MRKLSKRLLGTVHVATSSTPPGSPFSLVNRQFLLLPTMDKLMVSFWKINRFSGLENV